MAHSPLKRVDRYFLQTMTLQTVCVVATLRDELKFVDEWLAYHRLLGVDHFLLYDDDPGGTLERHIVPHLDYATVVPWYGRGDAEPDGNRQAAAYMHSLDTVRDEFEWVCFLDLDEFIVLRRHANVAAYLDQFADAGSVSLFWRNFGHNGFFEDPGGLVTSALTRRRRRPGRQYKSFTRTRAIRGIKSAHQCELHRGYRRADANGDAFYPNAVERDPHGEAFPAYINHYYCRSFKRWMERSNRGSVVRHRDRPSEQWKFSPEGCLRQFVGTVAVEFNEHVDDSLAVYETSIKEYLSGLGVRRFPEAPQGRSLPPADHWRDDFRVDPAPGSRGPGLSFCIATRGGGKARTLIQLESIRNTCAAASVPHQVILAGQFEPLPDGPEVQVITVTDAATRASLGALRNVAAGKAVHETLVFVDDDIIFPEAWASRLLRFSDDQPWLVLGNRVLLPDGGRFWDRATYRPHRLVDYDHPLADPELYQSGAFMVIRRDVYLLHRWSDSIAFYAEHGGGLNEDVEYSRRLIADRYRIHFDPGNTVWHWNDNYEQVGDAVSTTRRTPLRYCEEFSNLIRSLTGPIRPAADG